MEEQNIPCPNVCSPALFLTLLVVLLHTHNKWGKKTTKCVDLAMIYILTASAAVFFPTQEHQQDRISLSQRETEQGSFEPQALQWASLWDWPVCCAVVMSLSFHLLWLPPSPGDIHEGRIYGCLWKIYWETKTRMQFQYWLISIIFFGTFPNKANRYSNCIQALYLQQCLQVPSCLRHYMLILAVRP